MILAIMAVVVIEFDSLYLVTGSPKQSQKRWAVWPKRPQHRLLSMLHRFSLQHNVRVKLVTCKE